MIFSSLKQKRLLTLSICGVLFFMAAVSINSQTISYFQTGEEFAGPFASWKNVKTDYGATGNGSTDDAAAISAALTAVRSANTWTVLYFPAGTYRINSTTLNSNYTAQVNNGLRLVGEDPATTIIQCGTAFTSTTTGQGAMMRLEGNYSTVSRLTFDGNSKATFGILRDGTYGTNWRFSDIFFKNITGVGLQYGGASDLGQDLSVMTRCHFTNCGTGIKAMNQNCIGPYAWYCLFEDCTVGIDNYVGFVHSICNVFLRSKECDIKQGYIGFMVMNNTSVGSNRFLGFVENKCNVMANNNKVYNTVDPISMYGANVMLDNVIRSSTNTGPALLTTKVNTMMVGNTFTVQNPVAPVFVPANAIDNNPATVCYDINALKFSSGEDTFNLTWTLPANTTKVVTKYAITSGAIPLCDPFEFKLLGSTNGTTWVLLNQQTNQTWASRQLRKEFTTTNTTAYNRYQLRVTRNQNTPTTALNDYRGGVQIAELELLDAAGVDITEGSTGTLTGRLPDFLPRHCILQQSVVDASTLPVPTSIQLPGVPQNKNRKVFEAASVSAIQSQINAAAQEPVGSNPVVHIPKGNYTISSTITIPANHDMQIIGDEARGSTNFSWGGSGLGPMIRLLGPSRVTMSNIIFNMEGLSGGPDVISIENCDQAGGRIFMDQVDCQGGFATNQFAGINYMIDAVEWSDISCYNNYNLCATVGVAVKGGRNLAAGASTWGQIAFLMGYNYNWTANFLRISNSGKLIYAGYRAENTGTGLATLNANSSGKLTFACNNQDLTSVPSITPFVINGFKGTLSAVGNHITSNGIGFPVPHYTINGDGSKCNVLSACNDMEGPTDPNSTVDKIWTDNSSPAANAAFMSNVGCFPNWNWKNMPDVYQKAQNVRPNDQFILNSLQELRGLRIEPPMNRAAGVTDVKLVRLIVMIPTARTGIAMRADTSIVTIKTRSGDVLYQLKTNRLINPGCGNFSLPAGVTSVFLYNALGKMLFEREITGPHDIAMANKFIEGLKNKGIIIAKMRFDTRK